MTTDTATLQALLARVESADGPDRDLDRDLHAVLDGWEKVWNEELEFFQLWKGGRWIGLGSIATYTASIDAALALVERLLPVRDHDYVRLSGRHRFSLSLPGADRFTTMASGATAPLAILAALLKALIANNA